MRLDPLAFLDASPLGSMIVVDTQLRIVNINNTANTLADYTKNDFLTKPLEVLCSDRKQFFRQDDLTELQQNGVWHGIIEQCNKKTKSSSLRVSAYAIRNHSNEIEYYTLFVNYADTIAQEHNSFLHTTQIDALTELPNRSYLINLLEKKIPLAYIKKEVIGLFFIEFDDLSRFNDTLGIDMDDRLIVQLSKSIRSIIDINDTLARVGNHQFAIVAENITSEETAKIILKRMMHMLSEPFVIDSNMFYISASIGISLFPNDVDDAYKLLKTAENSMKHAQKDGKNHFAFTHNQIVETSYNDNECLMADLPAAIENEEIYFLLQPQYNYHLQRYSGAELLARWKHPKYGEISPAVFIPLAEQSGMIGPLTVKAMMEVSKIFAMLETASVNDFSLSINISSFFLMKSDFIETVQFFMENYDLAEKKLNFEITEEILTQNIDNLVQILEKIKKMGIEIEIDDYGTGFTSINYLANLPIDTLKIDRMFVSDIDKETKKWTLFKAIYDMASALGIDVIVEGVENSFENDVITSFENVTIQGYFYSKPIPFQDLLEVIGK